MIIRIAALSAAVLLGSMSQAVFAQAPTAPAVQPGTASPAVKAPVGVPGKAAAPVVAKPAVQAPVATKVGAKAPPPINACKGLSDTDCGTKTEECSYVKAYKTKAGKTVAGYCKAKPKTKAKAAVKTITAPAAAVKPSAPPVGAPAAKTTAPAPKN